MVETCQLYFKVRLDSFLLFPSQLMTDFSEYIWKTFSLETTPARIKMSKLKTCKTILFTLPSSLTVAQPIRPLSWTMHRALPNSRPWHMQSLFLEQPFMHTCLFSSFRYHLECNLLRKASPGTFFVYTSGPLTTVMMVCNNSDVFLFVSILWWVQETHFFWPLLCLLHEESSVAHHMCYKSICIVNESDAMLHSFGEQNKLKPRHYLPLKSKFQKIPALVVNTGCAS